MKSKEKTNEDLIKEYKSLQRKILKLERLGKEQDIINRELSVKIKQLTMIETHMIDCISQVNMEGIFLYLSPSNEYAFGYKPEDMVGKSAFNYFHPEDLPTVLEGFTECLKSGELGRVEFRFLCADGTYLWVESVGNFIRNENGIVENIILVSRIIEERKKLEEISRQSEEQYRRITENMSDTVAELDAQGIIRYISPSDKKIFGDNHKRVVGNSAFDTVHPDDKDRVAAQYMEGILTKKDREVEYRMQHTDGHYVWLRTVGHPLFDAAGELLGMIVNSNDITERKQAESDKDAALEALRQSEAQYRLLSEHTTDSVWLMDMNLKVIYFSPSVGKLRGFTEQEILKMPWDQHITPESLKLVSELLAEELPKVQDDTGYNPVRTVELEYYCKDGSLLLTENKFSIIRDDCGIPTSILGEARDIRERKRSEDALRESEEKYRSITENMTDIVSLLDARGFFKYTSPSHRKIFGDAENNLIGISAFARVHPEDRDRVESKFIEGVRTKADKEVEYRFRHADGHYVWIRSVGHSFFDESGEFAGSVVSSSDITERKQLEAQREIALDALRESEERYRRIAENMRDIVCDLDAHACYKYASPSHGRILGYDPKYILGTSVFDGVHPEDRDRVVAAYVEGVRTKKDTEVEYRHQHADGHYVWLRSAGHSFFNATGDFVGAIVSSSDISERKQAEEKLRESEQFLRQTQAIALMGGWKANPETDFLQWTEGVYRLLEIPKDYHPDLTEGMKYYNPADIPLLKGKILNTLTTNEPFAEELEITTASGKKLWAEVRGLSHVMEGQTPVVIGTIQDITARKQAEEEKRLLEERLQQADKMESIGTLAGGIAHDFNNLLAGIQGYVSMTLMNLKKDDPNYERLQRIQDQVQSGGDLTRQLLGFARGGRYEIKPSDMNEILEKTSSMFGRTKKEISIQRKSAKGLWSVEVDRGQMEQVFMNLYVNAWQAMPGGGDIYLETQNTFLNDEQRFPYFMKPGKYVKITITDTGTGMDEKTKEKIFEPFFTTKAMGRGTGLGLASAYGIIKGHGGMINVYSEPGHGTTFTIYLPASEKRVVQEDDPLDEIIMGTETILLIDDEKIVMEVNKELLETMGYTVYAAGSGQEGLAVYMEKKDKIDLVILDMIMPGISGSVTFDRLRQINPEVKVLLSSGYSLNGKAQAIIDRGCNGFLQKPFKPDELSGKVREILREV